MKNSIAYRQLEKKMSDNNCNQNYFNRVSSIKGCLDEYECNRLQDFMTGTKALASVVALGAGYSLGSYVVQQFTDDNVIPKIIGGLTALVAAKLIAKPAARAGLDLGLRI